MLTQSKSEYMSSLESRVKTLEQELERLETKAATSKRAPSATLAEVRKTFEEKRKSLRAMMAKAKNTSESAWKELQTGLESAWTELGRSFHRVKKELEDTKEKVTSAGAAR